MHMHVSTAHAALPSLPYVHLKPRCTYACIYVYACAPEVVKTTASVYIRMCMCMCMYACVCMYMHVYMHVCAPEVVKTTASSSTAPSPEKAAPSRLTWLESGSKSGSGSGVMVRVVVRVMERVRRSVRVSTGAMVRTRRRETVRVKRSAHHGVCRSVQVGVGVVAMVRARTRRPCQVVGAPRVPRSVSPHARPARGM